MSKFSPGPWRERPCTDYTWDIEDSKGSLVCQCPIGHAPNRRLIAAAPDLFERLRGWVEWAQAFEQMENLGLKFDEDVALLARIDGDSNE